MSAQVLEYNSANLNALPVFFEALKAFKTNGGSDAVYGTLKDIIAKSGAASRFGITLIGRPIYTDATDTTGKDGKPVELDADSRYISVGGVRLPLPVSNLDAETQAKLVPATWGFTKDGAIFPVHYSLSADAGQGGLSAADVKLFSEIHAAVAGTAFGHAVGVEVLAHQQGGLKIPQQKGVVVSAPAELIPAFAGNVEEIAWSFGAGEGEVEATSFVSLGGGAQSYGDNFYGPVTINQNACY
ncbi:hypothetical protein HGRIS_014442 [Hohenbuehelia grisea]|uniref:Uncharacterized protein n=1 Tax=Hohenbuehelia grisea TaxID=104357 RepID=A0ABR3JVM3_9AGAR